MIFATAGQESCCQSYFLLSFLSCLLLHWRLWECFPLQRKSRNVPPDLLVHSVYSFRPFCLNPCSRVFQHKVANDKTAKALTQDLCLPAAGCMNYLAMLRYQKLSHVLHPGKVMNYINVQASSWRQEASRSHHNAAHVTCSQQKLAPASHEFGVLSKRSCLSKSS